MREEGRDPAGRTSGHMERRGGQMEKRGREREGASE